MLAFTVLVDLWNTRLFFKKIERLRRNRSVMHLVGVARKLDRQPERAKLFLVNSGILILG